jgi:WD40 repeat protein
MLSSYISKRAHTGEVNSVVITPDGKQAISGSEDETIKVWNPESSTELRTLKRGLFPIHSLAITPDGQQVVSGSENYCAQVRSLKHGKILHDLYRRGCGSTGWSVKVSPDGKQAISSAGCWINVWDLASRECLYQIMASEKVGVMAVTPDGQHCIVVCVNSTLEMWKLSPESIASYTSEKPPELRYTLKEHDRFVIALAMTPDGRQIISGLRDHTIKVWNTENMSELHTLKGHTDLVTAVVISSDGHHVISTSYDNTLRIWDLQTGALIVTFDAGAPLSACAVTQDGGIIVAGDKVGRIHFIHLGGLLTDPPIITAWHSKQQTHSSRQWWQLSHRPAIADTLPTLAFGCPFCCTWSRLPESALGIELPCPNCGQLIKLNPFTINADWQPVAKAWKVDARK